MYSYPGNFKCQNIMDGGGGGLQCCGGGVSVCGDGVAVGSVGGGGGGANHTRKN